MREANAPGPRPVGRPREFDEDEALDALMRAFWAKGYEGTALSDLMAATGLKKGSLYAAFGDKRAMYARALARYETAQVAAGCAALTDAAAPPETRIAGFLRSAIAPPKDAPPGCFLCNASVDPAIADPEAAAVVRRGFERLSKALERALADRPGAALTADARRVEARALLTTYAGLRVQARAGVAENDLEDALALALERIRAEPARH